MRRRLYGPVTRRMLPDVVDRALMECEVSRFMSYFGEQVTVLDELPVR
tara:strand:+ start:2042 stop:2185 length:144 start_codon:yes stop_codon:yes gene_type:complete